MSADQIIKEAIQAAAREHNQSSELASILSKWVTELLSGNESISDVDLTHRRAEEAFERVVLEKPDRDIEDAR
jgi:hypothetical protein